MLKLDHFASIFRAADKERILIPHIRISKVLLVTDVDKPESMKAWNKWKSFFPVDITMEVLDGEESRDISLITKKVKDSQCDIIVSYRCLHTDNWRYPYAVGSYVEVLTQMTDIPVLLFPHIYEDQKEYSIPKSVLLMSEDLKKEEELLGYASSLCNEESSITLVDLEDTVYLDRILSIISKIPQLDTDMAEKRIREQLQNESLDWVERSKERMAKCSAPPTLHHARLSQSSMSTCIEFVEQSDADMIVLNAKNTDQLSIHGLVYPFMVQFRSLPLLLR